MKFTQLTLPGAYLIEPELLQDDRGFFARSFCQEEFKKHKLLSDVIQCNISFNKQKGTLRGMHFQIEPHSEAKLVRCTKGSIYDVIIDLRQSSSTYMQWIGIDLTEENRSMLYIPEGFAHGFQTLTDNSEVFYQMYNVFVPGAARGIKWDDKSFNIKWPLPISKISEKDLNYPAFQTSDQLECQRK